MVAAHRKAVDKSDVCKHVLALLKKTYSTAALKKELPVLETLLYAVCLEDTSLTQADEAYAKLRNGFHDLNEVRVSSVYELEALFANLPEPHWRALRIRSILQYVFEATYGFDFEPFRRKTVELAQKQLAKIKPLSPFIKAYVLQHSLESHVLPVDQRMLHALQWLGLAEPGATPEHAGDALRSAVRKADAPLFCFLLRCLRDDPRMEKALARGTAASEEMDGYARLTALFKGLKTSAPAKPEKGTSKAAPAPKADASKKKPASRSPGKAAAPASKKKRK